MNQENSNSETVTCEPCYTFECDWKEEYYGWRCTRCNMFYAFGQAPWEETDDDDYEDDFADDEYEPLLGTCPDCWHTEEFCECGELPPEAKHDDDCPCCRHFRNEDF